MHKRAGYRMYTGYILMAAGIILFIISVIIR